MPTDSGHLASSSNMMSLLRNIRMADISSLDLNLLRLFEAIYRHRNISRAANEW